MSMATKKKDKPKEENKSTLTNALKEARKRKQEMFKK
jgi:hypothetical protein